MRLAPPPPRQGRATPGDGTIENTMSMSRETAANAERPALVDVQSKLRAIRITNEIPVLAGPRISLREATFHPAIGHGVANFSPTTPASIRPMQSSRGAVAGS